MPWVKTTQYLAEEIARIRSEIARLHLADQREKTRAEEADRLRAAVVAARQELEVVRAEATLTELRRTGWIP